MSIRNEILSGILSDTAIKEYWGNGIHIQTEYKSGPLAFDLDKQLQPGSIDLRFRNEISRFKLEDDEVLSFDRIRNKDYLSPDVIPSDKTLIIQPGEIILTTTLESISLSENFAGIITGRSSFARLGLMVQCCQDFINPGLKNSVALQLINLSPYAIELDMNIPICQLVILKMLGSPAEGYNEKSSSKYTGEKTFIPSKIDNEAYLFKIPATQNFLKIIKTTFKKYIEPLLPTLMSILIVTPLINNFGSLKILQILSNVSINAILIFLVLILYFYSKKGDN